MINRIFIIITIVILLFNVCMPVFAGEMDNVNLTKIGDAPYHLKYYPTDNEADATYIICSIVGYYNNNKFFPAYCMNSNLPGVENGDYVVDTRELINNEAVWRVVTNGYPYLTAGQMGLENDYDAYMVTKMAIYCVLGQSDINHFTYDTGDTVGQRMLDVLRYLVNNVATGNATPPRETFSVDKVGELTEFKECYYQEYSMDAKINMSKYKVNISNFPKGTYITNSKNKSQSVFKSVDKFRIFIPKTGFNNDIKGKIKIEGIVENYPVFYGKAPSGKQNYAVTYDTYGSENKEVGLNINTNTGKLKVIKVDEETKIPLSGIKFELKGNDKVYEGITNENGEIIFENLYQGRYTLTELETAENYILNSTPFDINIEYGKENVITVDNSIKTGKIKIIKKDKDTGEALEGVSFQILNANTKEVIEELFTNKNGEAESSYLRVDGEYILKETWEDSRYVKNNEELVFNVNSENIVEIEIENEKVKGSLKIKKVDSKNNEKTLEGVKFELYDSNMNLLESLETDKNGEAFSKKYPSVNEVYYLKEVETKRGYKLNEELIEVKLIDNEILDLLITNSELKKLPKTGK